MLWWALSFYAISLLFALWRMGMGLPYRPWVKFALLLPGFLLHTIYLWERGLAAGHCPVSNLFETLTFITWCLVALHLVIAAVWRIHYLTAFYMPLVLVIQLAALIARKTDRPAFENWQESSWLGLHASLITLGYAAFGLAGAVALMYLVQERQLRTRRLGPSFMLLPPILRLEGIQVWLLAGGFVLLTVGLVSGFAGMHFIRQRLLPVDPKLLWSGAIWAMYLILLLGRQMRGWSGRWLAWSSVVVFAFVLATFWISNALSQFHRY